MSGRIDRKMVASNDGASIYYEVHKNSPASATIFLVHGIGGDTDGWQYVRTILLKEGFSVVAMDVRGHGYSDHPKRARDYAFERINEDIFAVMEAEKIQKPVLVGHSGGAIIAARFAAEHSHTISALVLIAASHEPPAYISSPFKKAVANAVISVGAFISPPPYKRWHSSYPQGKVHKEFEVYGLVRTIFYNSLRSYLLLSRELITVDFTGHLEKISVSTLLIAGEKDGIFPLRISYDMHGKIADSKLVVLPETNHVSILNNPSGVAHAITNFLRN